MLYSRKAILTAQVSCFALVFFLNNMLPEQNICADISFFLKVISIHEVVSLNQKIII